MFFDNDRREGQAAFVGAPGGSVELSPGAPPPRVPARLSLMATWTMPASVSSPLPLQLGDYLFVFGGFTGAGNNSTAVWRFDAAGTCTIMPALGAATRCGQAARIGGPSQGVARKALFISGYSSPNVYMHDEAGTRTTLTALSTYALKMGICEWGTTGGVLAAGGFSGLTKAYYWDCSGTMKALAALTTGRGCCACVHIPGRDVYVPGGATSGDWGTTLVAGGTAADTNVTGTAGLTAVDAYNQALTKVSVAALARGRAGMAAGFVGDRAVFAGGGCPATATIETYDRALTRTTLDATLSTPRGWTGASHNNSSCVLDGSLVIGPGSVSVSLSCLEMELLGGDLALLSQEAVVGPGAFRGMCAWVVNGERRVALVGGRETASSATTDSALIHVYRLT